MVTRHGSVIVFLLNEIDFQVVAGGLIVSETYVHMVSFVEHNAAHLAATSIISCRSSSNVAARNVATLTGHVTASTLPTNSRINNTTYSS